MGAAYENLKFYQDICEIRRLVYGMTKRFWKTDIRLVSQMRAAARSAKQNIREFYKLGTLGQFRRGIVISLGSLEELSGDVEDCLEDRLISKAEFTRLTDLIKSADYMAGRYLRSLYEMEQAGTWKAPLGRTKSKSSQITSRNLLSAHSPIASPSAKGYN